MEQKVPLVIYNGDERVIVGDALVNGDGYAIMEIFDKKIAHAILGEGISHLSFGFDKAGRVGFTTETDTLCKCYVKNNVKYKTNCLLHRRTS